MFVRIVFLKTKDNELGRDIIEQCDRVEIHQDEKNAQIVWFRMMRLGEGESARGQSEFSIEKGKARVYLMNDQGKTIDRYTWKED